MQSSFGCEASVRNTTWLKLLLVQKFLEHRTLPAIMKSLSRYSFEHCIVSICLPFNLLFLLVTSICKRNIVSSHVTMMCMWNGMRNTKGRKKQWNDVIGSGSEKSSTGQHLEVLGVSECHNHCSRTWFLVWLIISRTHLPPWIVCTFTGCLEFFFFVCASCCLVFYIVSLHCAQWGDVVSFADCA